MKSWFRDLSCKVRVNELLSNHTTFKIGGCAKYFVQPKDIDDLRSLLLKAKVYKMPVWIIGSGSNLLINDHGLDGIVIDLNAAHFKKIRFKSGLLEAGAGVKLQTLVRKTCNLGLSGAEFLAGIPGTVGGALIMNAGIKEKEIKDIIEDVTVLDYNANTHTLNGNKIRFGYRNSNLSKYIVIKASFKLRRQDKSTIKEKIKKYVENRWRTQDFAYPNAGCVFKNPKGLSAGKLIDRCGLKNRHFGKAWVSAKHANFIINKNMASAKDVLRLMNFIKQKVKRKFGIELEPEIKIW